MNLLQRVVLALAVACAVVAAGPAGAATKTFNVTGKVLSTSSATLAASYGVTPGAPVSVSYTLDLEAPVLGAVGPPDNQTSYTSPFTFLVISVGTWTVVLDPNAPVETAAVADASGATGLDLLHLTTGGLDNDGVLRQGAQLVVSLDFYAPRGGASSNQSLDQDPNAYDFGVGSAIGPGGNVVFSFGDATGKGPKAGVSPQAVCTAAELGAAGKLCQSQLKCHAGFAKNPGKDPGAVKRDACLAKADAAFDAAFTKAQLSAAKKGLSCAGAGAPASARIGIDERVSSINGDVTATDPPDAAMESSWLGAAATACKDFFAAAGKNETKPDALALQNARFRAGSKLKLAADKALAKAQKKGVVFVSVEPTIELTTSVKDLVDEVLAEAFGID